jgi:plasmid stabilization system protein ParE
VTSNQEFEYHPEAIAEAWEAFHWYLERSEAAADSFWDELRDARSAVTEHPETWGAYLHGTRCLTLRRFPYGLVYIERGDRILGIAVAHLKRRPGYWKSRLAD